MNVGVCMSSSEKSKAYYKETEDVLPVGIEMYKINNIQEDLEDFELTSTKMDRLVIVGSYFKGKLSEEVKEVFVYLKLYQSKHRTIEIYIIDNGSVKELFFEYIGSNPNSRYIQASRFRKSDFENAVIGKKVIGDIEETPEQTLKIEPIKEEEPEVEKLFSLPKLSKKVFEEIEEEKLELEDPRLLRPSMNRIEKEDTRNELEDITKELKKEVKVLETTEKYHEEIKEESNIEISREKDVGKVREENKIVEDSDEFSDKKVSSNEDLEIKESVKSSSTPKKGLFGFTKGIETKEKNVTKQEVKEERKSILEKRKQRSAFKSNNDVEAVIENNSKFKEIKLNERHRLILITGARNVGKTTLVKELGEYFARSRESTLITDFSVCNKDLALCYENTVGADSDYWENGISDAVGNLSKVQKVILPVVEDLYFLGSGYDKNVLIDFKEEGVINLFRYFRDSSKFRNVIVDIQIEDLLENLDICSYVTEVILVTGNGLKHIRECEEILQTLINEIGEDKLNVVRNKFLGQKKFILSEENLEIGELGVVSGYDNIFWKKISNFSIKDLQGIRINY